MEKLLTYKLIAEFVQKYPEQELSSIAAAAIIGIKTIGECPLSHYDLWKKAHSLSDDSASIMHLQNKLSCLQEQVRSNKIPQETPRFCDEGKKIRRASSLSRHRQRSLRCHKRNLHSRKENSFLRDSEESEVVNIADKFLADPMLAGLFRANPTEKTNCYWNHTNIQNGSSRPAKRCNI